MLIKFSYVIVTYNVEDLIVNCINSILKHENNIEIIIIDNNSTDNTIKIIKELNNNNVKLIASPINLGFSKANNIGLRESIGEYVIFLNPDTILIEPITNYIQLVHKKIFKNKNVILAPKLLNLDKTNQHSTNSFPIHNF